MFNTLKNAWRIPDLRKKLLYTLLIIIAFRFGSVVPVPFLNVSALNTLMASANETALGYINMLTGGAFANATLFAMGITPYINSSIIIQLLTVAIPALERMAKEGEEGRKKIAAITRYTTVGLGLIQGTAYYFYLRNNKITLYNEGFSAVFTAIIIVLTFTAGTALIMWMGEQINQKGVGNGISIILFAGIVARLPVTMGQIWSYFSAAMQSPESYGKYFVFAPLFIILFLAVIWVIVFMNDSERRIPVQYAKKVVGRKVYGGQSTFLADQSDHERRYAGHLRVCDPLHSEHHSSLCRRTDRLLEGLLQCLLLHRLAVQCSVPAAHRCVCLLLHDDPVQPD